MMRILIACEFSGVARDAFRRKGHEAWSCDLSSPEGEWPNYHLSGDCRVWLEQAPFGPWDMLIAHPPCTYLTNSAAWAYGDGPYHQRLKPGTLTGSARRQARQEAVAFVRDLMSAHVPCIAIENPIGHLSTAIGRPAQIIHPHQFGDDASKATCLWLKKLPCLVPTASVPPRMVNGKPRWSNQTDSGQNKLSPSAGRAMLRAATYPGIAAAMAEQWGGS